METKRTYEVPLELDRDGEVIQIKVQLEMAEDKLMQIRAVGQGAEDEYDVSFVVKSRHHPYGCYICRQDPCPPNHLVWYSPCPIPPPDDEPSN